MPQGDMPSGWADDCERAVTAAIEAAVAEEREAIAKAVDALGNALQHDPLANGRASSGAFAAARLIRAR